MMCKSNRFVSGHKMTTATTSDKERGSSGFRSQAVSSPKTTTTTLSTTTINTSNATLNNRQPTTTRTSGRKQLKVSRRKTYLFYLRQLIGLVLILKSFVYIFNLSNVVYGTCELYDCTFLATNVTNLLDPRSAGACDNFYDYACGRVLLVTDPSMTDASRLKPKNYTVLLENMLAENVTADDNEVTRKMKQMYHLCLRGNSKEDFQYYLSHVMNIRRWPLQDDDDRDQPDWETLAGNVAQLRVETLFGLELNRAMIILAPLEPTKLLTEERLLRNVTFGVTDSGTKVEIDKVVVLGLLLTSALERVNNMTDYRKLITEHPNIQFDKYFKSFFGNFKVDLSQIPIAMPSNYLAFLEAMIGKQIVSKLTIKNYIIAKLIIAYTEHIHSCITILDRWAVLGVNIVSAQRMGDRNVQRSFHRFAKSVQVFMVNKLKRLKSTDAKVRRWAVNQVKKIKFLVGWPKVFKDGHFVSQLAAFRNCSFEHDQGFYVVLLCFQRQTLLARISGRSRRFPSLMEQVSINVYNAFYTDSLVGVPLPVMAAPFFDPNYPPVANYAGAGYVLAHEISHSLDIVRITSPFEGFPPEHALQYTHRASCFIQHYNNYSATSPRVTFNDPSLTLNENLADVIGTRAVFEMHQQSLVKWADREGALVRPPGLPLNFTLNQVFFLRLAQLNCAPKKFLPGDPHAPFFVRISGMLKGMAEFADAFACPPGSAMSSTHQCLLYS